MLLRPNSFLLHWRIVKLAGAMTILTFLLSVSAYSNEEKTQGSGGFTGSQLNEIKKTVVFFAKIDDGGKPSFYATGFLVAVENVFHLVTAKHVVVNMKTGKLQDDGMFVSFNSKDGKIVLSPIEDIKKNFNVNWVFHKNAEVDIAVIPFRLNPQKDDVKVIPDNLFLPTDRIFELYDVFFLSYQPGIEPKRKISPVFRGGIISTINDDKSFYIDASAFPGNSGSPVFLKPSPIRFDKGGISIGVDPLGGKFIGIIGEYIPYQEIAISLQTGRPRVIFEENTGLSKVWSVKFIKEIFNSDQFKKQLNNIQTRSEPPVK